MSIRLFPLLLFGLCLGVSLEAQEPTADHTAWDTQLQAHVTDTGVDYQGWSRDDDKLNDYLEAMSRIDDSVLPRDEQMALYINLYNAWTVRLILDNLKGLKSIKDIPNRWNKKIVRLKGRTVSLDHLEHKILRPRFKDSRIHFAVNCASRGCPDLWRRAYVAQQLDDQLNAARDRFFTDTSKGVDVGDEEGALYGTNHVLRVSKIFSWFDDDFEREAGSIIGYVARHGTAAQKAYLKKHKGDIDLEYFDYDWSLNAASK